MHELPDLVILCLNLSQIAELVIKKKIQFVCLFFKPIWSQSIGLRATFLTIKSRVVLHGDD